MFCCNLVRFVEYCINNLHGRSFWGSSEEVLSDVADDDMDTVGSWSTGIPPSRGTGEPVGDPIADRHDT